MSTASGDGEVEATQVLSEGDLEELPKRQDDRGPQTGIEPIEDTRVMEDSQLRELVESRREQDIDPAAEAELRKRRAAEQAAREREAALKRVRAHRRESANTRALRPAGATPPEEAKVALSRDALDMLEREIPLSDRPQQAQAPERKKPETPPPANHQSATTRPPRGTVPLPRQPVPPPAPAPGGSMPARMKALVDALDEVERLLRAGAVEEALEVVSRVERG